MRRPRVLVVGLLAAGLCLAASAGWRDADLPPEAAQLNRTADHAASAATAARLYVQSLKLAPDNGPALYGLGRALLDLDRPAEALKVFRRLAKFHPGEADVLEALAAAIARQPDLRRAGVAEGRALADRAAQLQPDRPEAWHVLSVLCHLDG
ncbi:MAG TPA: tetratricopeptide repeat protein, partial [Kiritimatiellia bacterium]|nr:tetratricopeptide repeat protein [Kiritimatiellia bacterium]